MSVRCGSCACVCVHMRVHVCARTRCWPCAATVCMVSWLCPNVSLTLNPSASPHSILLPAAVTHILPISDSCFTRMLASSQNGWGPGGHMPALQAEDGSAVSKETPAHPLPSLSLTGKPVPHPYAPLSPPAAPNTFPPVPPFAKGRRRATPASSGFPSAHPQSLAAWHWPLPERVSPPGCQTLWIVSHG